MRHYRLSCPVIPDNLDRQRHIIRVSGITNVAVFGGDGICTFNKSFMAESPGGFEKVIDAALEETKGPGKKSGAFVDGGTVYPPAVRAQGRIVRQRTPDLAPGSDGEVFLVYATDESGSSDVMLRSCKGGSWGKEVKVAATKADEYSPAVVSAGKGAAVVAYVSNEKGLYDIFTVIVKGGKAQKPQQLTHSTNDAMAPRQGEEPAAPQGLLRQQGEALGRLHRRHEPEVASRRGVHRLVALQGGPRDRKTAGRPGGRCAPRTLSETTVRRGVARPGGALCLSGLQGGKFKAEGPLDRGPSTGGTGKPRGRSETSSR